MAVYVQKFLVQVFLLWLDEDHEPFFRFAKLLHVRHLLVKGLRQNNTDLSMILLPIHKHQAAPLDLRTIYNTLPLLNEKHERNYCIQDDTPFYLRTVMLNTTTNHLPIETISQSLALHSMAIPIWKR